MDSKGQCLFVIIVKAIIKHRQLASGNFGEHIQLLNIASMIPVISPWMCMTLHWSFRTARLEVVTCKTRAIRYDDLAQGHGRKNRCCGGTGCLGGRVWLPSGPYRILGSFGCLGLDPSWLKRVGPCLLWLSPYWSHKHICIYIYIYF